MNRRQLAHVIVELGERFALDGVIVIGSSAVFATLDDDVPEELRATRDVDVVLPADAGVPPERVEWVLGEGSEFDDVNGYYTQAVDLTTPTAAPRGWIDRCVALRVGRHTARCMEIHDLALAKYGAGREKDLAFTRALARVGAVDPAALEQRVPDIDTTPEHRRLILARIRRDHPRTSGR